MQVLSFIVLICLISFISGFTVSPIKSSSILTKTITQSRYHSILRNSNQPIEPEQSSILPSTTTSTPTIPSEVVSETPQPILNATSILIEEKKPEEISVTPTTPSQSEATTSPIVTPIPSTTQEVAKKATKITAGELMKKYGVAYLTTSISLSIISFSLCYYAVANGIDVQALLERVGIEVTPMSANAGTFTLAYFFHKAASPIRFPPTVFLTPFIAEAIFKKKGTEEKDNQKKESKK